MTTLVNRHIRAQPSSFIQWLALTKRTVRMMRVKGEFIIAVLAPLIFTIGFYLPLKYVMQVQGIDYAQFVMAIIVLQAMSFTMTSAAAYSAVEAMSGFVERMQTMPIAPLVPVAARVTGALIRSTLSLIAALGFGYLIGFRVYGGPAQTALFCLFALGVATALALGADVLGLSAKNPASVTQALTLPTLIFGMLSCGFVPETGFPAWIRPFVRNQPVSQFSFALRDLADPGITPGLLGPPLAWLIGMFVIFLPLAAWASRRRG
ncbi:ABC transporter permease [Skermania piniformis]|uniref:ABC transporter permease n=1 Tax=Skermania pinensis TaxID=39122 RepID=A0ABX8SC36_9ACTN|nr:ABC transporter permease [Skermania piniformis]QXQ14537.1 ABC transporter permease [Skermania piniformis]